QSVMRWIGGQCAIVLCGILLLQGQATPSASDQKPAATEQQQAAPSPASVSPANSESDSRTPSVESTNHKWHVKMGTTNVGAGYTYVSDPFFSPFFPYYGIFTPGFFYPGYFYGPYAPFYGPYPPVYGTYPPSFNYAEDKGKVELAVLPKTADVYLDGAYAGSAGDLKKIWLSPGAYDLEVSLPGGAPYRQRIYVLSGKSLKIKRNLLPQNVEN